MARTIKKLWHALPEGAFKQWVREKAHNQSQRGRAKYWREDGIYVLQTADFTLRTAEPPYNVPQLISQFEEKHQVCSGEFVIDAGAFSGSLTNFFAKQVGPQGRVISFEPDGISRAHVLRNLSLNGNPANVELLSEGLWNSEDQVEFCERGALGSSAFWDGPGGHKTSIRTTTIDKVIADRNLHRLDFVKMNIEGAEIKALQGATETIKRFRPHFAISTDHYVDGNMEVKERTCGIVETILKGHGYAVQTKTHGTEWVTYGTP